MLRQGVLSVSAKIFSFDHGEGGRGRADNFRFRQWNPIFIATFYSCIKSAWIRNFVTPMNRIKESKPKLIYAEMDLDPI